MTNLTAHVYFKNFEIKKQWPLVLGISCMFQFTKVVICNSPYADYRENIVSSFYFK